MTTMSEEKLKIYREKFFPEYSSGNWDKAEEIARFNDLGSVLRKSEYKKMLEISDINGMKRAATAMDLFEAGKKDEANSLNKINLDTAKYWAKISEERE